MNFTATSTIDLLCFVRKYSDSEWWLLDRLTSHESVASHTLLDLKSWRSASSVGGAGLSGDDEAMTASMLLIDTAGCGIEEVQEISTESKANPGEANIVRLHVLALLRSGLKPEDVRV
jgi:ATP-dependent RNA/DNA helicase IGHMBP2